MSSSTGHASQKSAASEENAKDSGSAAAETKRPRVPPLTPLTRPLGSLRPQEGSPSKGLGSQAIATKPDETTRGGKAKMVFTPTIAARKKKLAEWV
jgi:hypothetical protein